MEIPFVPIFHSQGCLKEYIVYTSSISLYKTMKNYEKLWLSKLRKCIYMYVGIYLKNICLLGNIASCKRIINLIPTFSHKMAAASEVANGNDFGIALWWWVLCLTMCMPVAKSGRPRGVTIQCTQVDRKGSSQIVLVLVLGAASHLSLL